jgi:hypothetical protein
MGTTGVLTILAQDPPPGTPNGLVKSSAILGVFCGCTRGDLTFAEGVAVFPCQVDNSALRGRILAGVSVDQASFAACKPGLRGAVDADGAVVLGRPFMELRLEVKRDRWWAKAAAASGNMA